MKIAVAMSGGVDSSVAAVLLKDQGYEIIGVTMRHFNNAKYGFAKDEGIELAISDAGKVCEKLGIPHYVIDVSEDFEKIVVNDFISEYERGKPPNPCALCNPTIKWGIFLKKVLELGADKIATGHYVKVVLENEQYNIYRAADEVRDQSYMLWRLNQRQLSQTIFPIADFSKTAIRKIARKFSLPVHDKNDSQEVCFIKGKYEDFLKEKISVKSGEIILNSGKIIGRHKGLPFYTVGQRKGLNTPWHSPLYVQKLDVKNNRLIVTDNPDDLLEKRFTIKEANWICGNVPQMTNISVQIRYNSKSVPVKKIMTISNGFEVVLEKSVRAITPGQSAVFYENNRLLGGGIIDETEITSNYKGYEK